MRDDHKRIRGLTRQLEAVDLRAHEMKNGVLQELFMELEIHVAIAEDLFFPEVQDLLEEPARARIGKLIEGHHEIELAIDELRQLRKARAPTRDYNDRLDELVDTIENHIDEEERDLLPEIDRVVEGHLNAQAMADRMLERRLHYLGGARYVTSRPEVVQNPHGGEQMRKTG
jgi:iron-sulfur cluster repair protein YtfE (RIC family)